MAIEKELLDQVLAGRDPNEVFAREGPMPGIVRNFELEAMM